MEYRWDPKIVTTDFELSLMKAVNYEFPQTRILGCYFHLKQAIFKKLKKYQINCQNSSIILSKIELITQIPIDQIVLGISFIKTFLVEDMNLAKFWNYFETTWLKRFDPSKWNVHSIEDKDLANRTNNALERYNRRLNDNFPSPHPTIALFVEVIKKEFEFYEQKLMEIRQNASGIIYNHPNRSKSHNLIEFEAYLRNNSRTD